MTPLVAFILGLGVGILLCVLAIVGLMVWAIDGEPSADNERIQ